MTTASLVNAEHLTHGTLECFFTSDAASVLLRQENHADAVLADRR